MDKCSGNLCAWSSGTMPVGSMAKRTSTLSSDHGHASFSCLKNALSLPSPAFSSNTWRPMMLWIITWMLVIYWHYLCWLATNSSLAHMAFTCGHYWNCIWSLLCSFTCSFLVLQLSTSKHPIDSIVAFLLICSIIYISMHSDTVFLTMFLLLSCSNICGHCLCLFFEPILMLIFASADWCNVIDAPSLRFISFVTRLLLAPTGPRFALSLINYVNFVLTLRTLLESLLGQLD